MKKSIVFGFILLLTGVGIAMSKSTDKSKEGLSSLQLRNLEALADPDECPPNAYHLIPCMHSYQGNECKIMENCTYIHCNTLTFCR